MKRNLGNIISNARKSKNISQKTLAEKLGISTQAVSKWESGISRPNAENLMKIFDILDIDTSNWFSKRSSPSFHKNTGMGSIRSIYKIGSGPSSSHAIGPERACMRFLKEHNGMDSVKVVLYGSLAKTGLGHGTDKVIKKTLAPIKTAVVFDKNTKVEHPNTMDMTAYRNGALIDTVRVISIGGGDILYNGEPSSTEKTVYDFTSFSQISDYCASKGIELWQFVEEKEGTEIWEYLKTVWKSMKISIQNGIKDEGILPGGLDVQKKAKQLFLAQHIDETSETKENRLICAYAFAVSEQNACGGTIVTAPTCGSAGVLPSLLYYEQQKRDIPDIKILHALATAGIIGNLIKTNASISGAECGCQAEIGSACAMAAAAIGQLFDLAIEKIEYAAEIALEHHLGLTCDPVCGLVQIPCIERNAVAAMRALNAVNLASLLWNTRKISFDSIVKTMGETGRDLLSYYRETSDGGMAKNYNGK